MKHKYTLEDAFEFGWPGIKGYSYLERTDFPHASAAMFEVKTHHGKVRSEISDRLYLVLEGSGEFVIDEEVIPVEPTDVIVVPRNTPYDYRGEMKLYLVHVPAYDERFEVQLE